MEGWKNGTGVFGGTGNGFILYLETGTAEAVLWVAVGADNLLRLVFPEWRQSCVTVVAVNLKWDERLSVTGVGTGSSRISSVTDSCEHGVLVMGLI